MHETSFSEQYKQMKATDKKKPGASVDHMLANDIVMTRQVRKIV